MKCDLIDKYLACVFLLLTRLMVSISQAQPVLQTAGSVSTAPLVKYSLIEFFSRDTMESKMVDDLIINSGTTSEIIKKKFQLFSIAQGKDPEKESRYKITHYPTLIITQADGTEIDRIVGLRRPSEVEATLKAAITGQSEIERAIKEAAAPSAGIYAHITLATALRLRGDQEGAFKEYLWVLDRGENVEAKLYSSTFRLAIQRLASLGMEYPPAMEELKKRQAAIEIEAESETATSRAIGRAFAMNEALGMTSRNVPLYLKIPKGSPLKQDLFASVFLALVRAKKYQEVAEVADMEGFVGSLYPRFRSGLDHHEKDGHNHDASASPAIKQRIATYTTAACETLISLGQVDKARRVAERAIDYLGKDNQSFVVRLNAIAIKSKAGGFSAWLELYLKTPKSESS